MDMTPGIDASGDDDDDDDDYEGYTGSGKAWALAACVIACVILMAWGAYLIMLERQQVREIAAQRAHDTLEADLQRERLKQCQAWSISSVQGMIIQCGTGTILAGQRDQASLPERPYYTR